MTRRDYIARRYTLGACWQLAIRVHVTGWTWPLALELATLEITLIPGTAGIEVGS
jgi:hypothetical protein